MNNDYSILVVDDSANIRFTIMKTLKAAGYTVEGVNSGKIALEKCSAKSFDLFIIDVVMPEIGGLELLQRLNVFDNTFEAIMVTGDENLEGARKSMEFGAFSYVGKSSIIVELPSQVAKALRMVDIKKQRLERITLLEKKAASRSVELESMVRLLEYKGRQLDAIINSMGEGIMAIDNQKSIVLMNRQAELITGTSFADCAGLQVSKAFPNRTFTDQLSLIIEKGSIPCKEQNLLSISGEGKGEKYFIVNTQLITDANGVRTGTLAIFLDQTDTINAQRMRDSFLSIAAHELRTPINICMNYVALVQHQWKNDDTRNEAVRGIQAANHRLMYLVNRIISLANLSNHTYSISRSATDIGRLVASKIKKIQSDADDKNIKIVVENRLSEPVLSIDLYLMRIVLTNIFNNAVKFSRIGGTVFIVIEQNSGKPNNDLSITVIDEGEGISERARNCLFQSFIQGEDPLTRTQGGLGTGLFLVKKAMELLGGSIDVLSEKGKGSTFTLKIPIP